VQRAEVRRLLARLGFVASFGDAPPQSGGWGATLVRLLRSPGMPDSRAFQSVVWTALARCAAQFILDKGVTRSLHCSRTGRIRDAHRQPDLERPLHR
jgi:hypothetical protein